MAKDPALLFYTSDFITGVSDLTMEERGQYITLLCLHHQKGRLTKKVIKISAPNVSKDVLAKFSKDEKGLYFNKRLEEEAEKRRKHSQKQSENSRKRWDKVKIKNKTKEDAMEDATALPLENENENENGLLRGKIKTSKNEIINDIKNIQVGEDIDKDELFQKLKSKRKYTNNNCDRTSQGLEDGLLNST